MSERDCDIDFVLAADAVRESDCETLADFDMLDDADIDAVFGFVCDSDGDCDGLMDGELLGDAEADSDFEGDSD